MNLQQEQKKKIKRSLRCLYLVLVLLPLLAVASYTWFSISRTPKVSEMGMSVASGMGMEIAFDPDSEEWTQYLDFREQLEEMAPLKPITWSEKEQCFFGAQFGLDGRISEITERLSDEANTNHTSSNSYYMKNTFYARTGEPVKVSLSPAVVGGDGTQGAGTYLIGTPVWNNESIRHDNGGNGAEYAIRVGIGITKYDAETKARLEDPVFYIYEPNCDGHVTGETGLVETPSIDGTETLVPEERMIRQTTSRWEETYPIERDTVVREPGEFTTDTQIFQLNTDEMAKIDIYVWLEGQDIDCTNAIGEEAQIFANIQFLAEAEQESGLEYIE